MISWHKVGQKVVCKDRGLAVLLDVNMAIAEPVVGTIYTIARVDVVEAHPWGEIVGFVLMEMPPEVFYAAVLFDPVYPQIIDQLRTLPSITPERVKEDA